MGIREEERRKRISKKERDKRAKSEREGALEGKIAEREKRRQNIRNENEVRRKVSSERGKMQGAVEPRKERSRE